MWTKCRLVYTWSTGRGGPTLDSASADHHHCHHHPDPHHHLHLLLHQNHISHENACRKKNNVFYANAQQVLRCLIFQLGACVKTCAAHAHVCMYAAYVCAASCVKPGQAPCRCRPGVDLSTPGLHLGFPRQLLTTTTDPSP